MFNRGGRRRERPSEGPKQLGVHTEVIVVGNPDTPVIQRLRALNHRIGLGLQGYSGQAMGYDQGDPANSMEYVIPTTTSPTSAYAAIGRPADAVAMQTPSEITDIVMSDPDLDPYQALLYNRIAR